jgi:hypothetical protein
VSRACRLEATANGCGCMVACVALGSLLGMVAAWIFG